MQNFFGNNLPNFNWMGGNPMNMGNNTNQMMNIDQYNLLKEVYGSGQNINQGNQSSFASTKTNINFKTTAGVATSLIVDRRKTLSDTILLFI